MLVQAENLTKYYGSNIGCEDICLALEEGQVFGLLGPNGAGKSTLVKMLMGLVQPSSGQAFIKGVPVSNPRVRQHLGYLPELFRFYDWLTARELLEIFARSYDIAPGDRNRQAMEALELVGLKGRENERIATYSKGMQQRLGLAGAVMHNPVLVFLDEPTSALDPRGRIEVREIIADLHARGTTVFINSHLLSEVEMTCTHLGFIKKGRLVSQGPMERYLLNSHQVMVEAEQVSEVLLQKWEREERLVEMSENRLVLQVENEQEIPTLVNMLVQDGARIYRVQTRNLGLEEVFLSLIDD